MLQQEPLKVLERSGSHAQPFTAALNNFRQCLHGNSSRLRAHIRVSSPLSLTCTLELICSVQLEPQTHQLNWHSKFLLTCLSKCTRAPAPSPNKRKFTRENSQIHDGRGNNYGRAHLIYCGAEFPRHACEFLRGRPGYGCFSVLLKAAAGIFHPASDEDKFGI